MRWVYDKSTSRYRSAPIVQHRGAVCRCLTGPSRMWKYSLPVVLVLLLAYTVFSVQLQWRSVTWRQPRRAGKETSTSKVLQTTQRGKYDAIDNTSRSWTTVESGSTTHSHRTIVQTVRPTGASNCVTHTSIAFIKVHKCGSTTLQRSFLRFGFTHRLNVALPRGRDSPTIGHDGLITRDDYEPSPGGARWDLFAHHGTYNRTQLLQLMKKDTKFITVLREPVSRLLSAFHYFRMERYFPGLMNETGQGSPVVTYLDDVKKWNSVYVPPKDRDFADHICIRNCMSRDLGLPEEDFDNRTAIDKFIRGIERDFSLVMILEHLDQSLILLRRRMCWLFEDIIYDNLYWSRKARYRKRDVITEDRRQNFIEENYADYLLYKHFKTVLLDIIKKEGKDFDPELQHFKRINAVIGRNCHTVTRPKSFILGPSQWNQRIRIYNHFCTLIRQEREFWDKMFRKRYKAMKKTIH
ncbi:galactose-3-O-sulfotransferase 2-like [Branchiostoma floridae]|uniref:Galactose-3-O-sulfotransferase 2-like n=1 Tax=Branchiostoma floridae TaxID=7739 RepID=A0A9J7LJU1_BRAFL|nr:galactose-3-O-sulfotransferase 2-like [Branchiostoma floridae]